MTLEAYIYDLFNIKSFTKSDDESAFFKNI